MGGSARLQGPRREWGFRRRDRALSPLARGMGECSPSGVQHKLIFKTIFGVQMTTGRHDVHFIPTDSVSLCHHIHYVMASYMTPASISASAVCQSMVYHTSVRNLFLFTVLETGVHAVSLCNLNYRMNMT